jgi:Family of unknown function (DUF6284)
MNIVTGRRLLVVVEDVDREPTAAELSAIEAEWPLIQAELDLVDAECAVALDHGDELAWRRCRRAEHRVLEARRALVSGRPAGPGVAA